MQNAAKKARSSLLLKCRALRFSLPRKDKRELPPREKNENERRTGPDDTGDGSGDFRSSSVYWWMPRERPKSQI